MTTACSEKGTPKRRLHCSIPLWATEDAEFNLRKISKPRSRDGSQPIRRWAFQSCIDGNCCYGLAAWPVLNRRPFLLWLSMDCTILRKR
jgi:hypothetical protein